MGSRHLKIVQKLPPIIVGSALPVGLGIGAAAYLIGLQTVETQRQQPLEASVQTGIDQVQDYIKTVAANIRLSSGRGETVAAIKAMSAAYERLAVA